MRQAPDLLLRLAGVAVACSERGVFSMTLLRWALICLVIAIVAGLLGFTNVAGASMDVARILFWIFLVGVVILFLLGIFAARTVAGP
jgi:uncharacterized membrane protein YtjA (UPF0391 family)